MLQAPELGRNLTLEQVAEELEVHQPAQRPELGRNLTLEQVAV